MRFYVFIALLVVAVSGIATPVAAQDVPNATTPTTPQPGDRLDGDREYVSPNVTIVDSGFNRTSGQAWVELAADDHIAVVVSDGGALSDGSGEIASRSVALAPDETTRVVLPATRVQGRVALVIDHPGGLYGHVISPSNTLIGGSFDARDAQITAASGAIVVSIVSLVMVLRHKSGRNHSPERIA